MKGKKKSVLIAILIIVAVQIVVAQALGVNLVDMVDQKTDSIASNSIINTSSILEQARQESLAETSSYIDGYISEIESTLAAYAASEVEAAKLRIKAKAQEVEDALEAQKEPSVNGGKTKIKIKIDEELKKQISEIENEITLMLQQKFSN